MIASISKIKLFKACRRAYQFKYLYELEPVQKSIALETGSGYHDQIEQLYKDEDLFLLNNADNYSKEHAMAIAYREYVYPYIKAVETEKWLRRKVGKHILVGRVDGIAQDGLLIEHKSTSQKVSDEYEYSLQWDEQILAYMFLKDVNEVYYTICRKPTIRQGVNETHKDFFHRMVDWYACDTNDKIRLLRISRSWKEIAGFAKSFEEICDEMERGVIYRNQCYCNYWGRRCEYSSICLNYDPNQEYIGFTKGGK